MFIRNRTSESNESAQNLGREINPRPEPESQRPYVIHKGRVVDAVYVEPEVSEWAGNPLYEALPRSLDKVQAGERLANYPKFDNEERNKPTHIRRLLLQNAMKSIFIPLDNHLDLQQRLQLAIRVGYSDRNPLAEGYGNQLESRQDEFDQYAGQYCPAEDNSATAASGFSVLGLSGGGKSRTFLRCLNLLPQVIRHSTYKGRKFTCKQIVWLKLDCPYDASAKGLCIQFFDTVDAILGTTYRQNYAGKRRTVDEMLSDMGLVAANHSIGMLVIDEIQRLSVGRPGLAKNNLNPAAERMLNFFVQLVNTSGVPVSLVGTYKGMAVLSGEFSQIRRGTGQGDMIWDRMENDEQWKEFTGALWHYLYVRKASLATSNAGKGKTLSDVLYEETQGIVDFAIKVFMFAQERAMETGAEKITGGLIRQVAREKLKIPRLILEALKMKDMRILERFEDIYPAAMKEYMSSQSEEPEVSGKLASAPEINALLKQNNQESTNHAEGGAGEREPAAPVTAEIDVTEGEPS
ncbi:MAG TPA: ATP-binding protein [Pyrinomonadaceae bacterium]|nr:ATP-binding protein [Pyrinomonadaceae bacterium]